MFQRKTGRDRFGQEHERSLEPEMMKRPRRSKQKTPEKQRIVAIVTGASLNYLKGTMSSEARKQSQGGSDKKMQTGKILDSCSGDKKESGRVLKNGVNFKRSYRIGLFGDVNAHRATCSSFLKDSKFKEYLTTDTSPGLLKLCPYKYCSLNHLQLRPLKSFIPARRRSLKSQTSLKMSGDYGCVDIYVDEHENGSTREVAIQVTDLEAGNMEIEWGEAEDFGSERLLEGENIEAKEASCNQEDCTKDWREFNPREPNYLPIVEEIRGEKVELKHQDMDERKNAEEWMIDYALQHTVSKLALERKKKVALLVEAFETVLPREPSPAFTYGRHLQACN